MSDKTKASFTIRLADDNKLVAEAHYPDGVVSSQIALLSLTEVKNAVGIWHRRCMTILEKPEVEKSP